MVSSSDLKARLQKMPAWLVAFVRTLADWSPHGTAFLGISLILGVTSSLLIQQRLEDLDSSSRQFASVTQSDPVIEPLDIAHLTLAPEDLRSLSPDDARAFNASLPFSTLPILRARMFIMAPDDLGDYARALNCLTAAVYYEAGNETTEGQAAVAQVVLNRMRHPAFPATVCGVVFEGSDRTTGCQFSFTCDGAMDREPSAAGWARAKAAAGAALNGSVAAGVGMATHYHTDWVAPYWAERLVKIRQIGTHIFYRWTGTWGLPGAFSKQHGGVEPIFAKMAMIADAIDLIEAPATPVVAETPTVVVLPAVRVPTFQMDTTAALVLPLPVPVPVPEPDVVTAAVRPPVAVNPLAAPTETRPARRSRLPVPR